jgi:hypothetical protein
MASEMSYGADKTFSIDGRVDTPGNGCERAKSQFWTKSGIKGGRVIQARRKFSKLEDL